MIDDILTIVRKELWEMIVQRSSLRSGIIRSLVLPLLILGVWLPIQSGPEWITESFGPLLWTWFPVFVVSSMICDAFAGERERHTLETLLASRLSDSAILYGKIAGAMAYGWGLTVAGVVLSVVTVNVTHWQGHVLMFETQALVGMLLLSLLASAMASGAGVLLSLRAKSVRDAQQTLSIALMVLFFGIGFGAKSLPAAWQKWIFQFFLGANLVATGIAVALVLLAIDAALILAARARFQRAKLALD
ncbi:MAG TPA: ABC transporter permease [Bryobacteraceae bacterium]|nr:ABC transporter permease [Bryobacteraceae bacterium]